MLRKEKKQGKFKGVRNVRLAVTINRVVWVWVGIMEKLTSTQRSQGKDKVGHADLSSGEAFEVEGRAYCKGSRVKTCWNIHEHGNKAGVPRAGGENNDRR